MATTTFERNDGIHSQTGLTITTTCMHTWVDEWLCELDHDEAEAGREKYTDESATINDAETRFFACSPDARREAYEEMQGVYGDEWEDRPQTLKALADKAQEIDGRGARESGLDPRGVRP